MFSANGSQVSSAATYIEDVFSTYLYTGTGSAQSINNGIDLAAKGGMVWTKSRSNAISNIVVDSVRGGTNALITNSTAANSADTGYHVSSFNSNGYSLQGAGSGDNSASGYTYASWTFRKQPKFFDVVTGTGIGTFSHSLGSTPGMIILKTTNNVSDWIVWHRSFSNATNDFITLNGTGAKTTYGSALWGTINSTSFNLASTDLLGGGSAGQWVAYIFAHNAGGFGLTGTDNVISCGSYTGNNSSSNWQNLGFEPQWLMVKAATSGSTGDDWVIVDNMRGVATGGTDALLSANNSTAEVTSYDIIDFGATGFSPKQSWTALNASGNTYIYIAIRRGPMKVPTDATKVFNPVIGANASSGGLAFNPGFPIDLVIQGWRNGLSASQTVSSRLQGNYKFLITSSTGAESSDGGYRNLASNQGLITDTGFDYSTSVGWCWKRAPGFLDVVCYTGTGANQTVAHGLGVTPELMIIKRRDDGAYAGRVYHKDLGSSYWLYLFYSGGDAASQGPNSAVWNGAPTATYFNVGTDNGVNASGSAIVAYLFATCPGVSKVGTLVNTGSSINVECGFTSGARFVMCKNTTSAGGWYVYDTARGIFAGNDPWLALNTTSAEGSITDDVDAYAGGFTFNGANWNTGTYIFLAIA